MGTAYFGPMLPCALADLERVARAARWSACVGVVALSEPGVDAAAAAVAVAVRSSAHTVLHQEVGQAAAELRTSVVRRRAVPWPRGASPVVLRQAVSWPMDA